MKTCNWPEGCNRPVRANGKCPSHNVMWKRKHPEDGPPKKRGPKAKRLKAADWKGSLSKPRLLGLLMGEPRSLSALADAYGGGRNAVLLALRKMEASGLKVERTHAEDNRREVLRHVSEAEVLRYLRAMAEVRT